MTNFEWTVEMMEEAAQKRYNAAVNGEIARSLALSKERSFLEFCALLGVKADGLRQKVIENA
ncbi:MAG: hypothetical protein IJX98_01445 [Clostridia bacterium]|nr:hypothetical protein [Clostridia bacterium]